MGKDGEAASSAASRSSRAVRMAIPILGIAGMAISGYLTYVELKGVEPVCLPGADCNAVLASRYSHLWGIPVSIFGLLMYALLTFFGFLLWRGRNERENLVTLAVFTVALSGTLYSAYLFYLQLVEIHAFCTWCIASALVVLSILVLSLRNLLVAR